MLLVLDSTSRTLRATMADPADETECSVTVTYADTTATTFVEGMYPIQMDGTNFVTILPAPASGTRRVVKSVMFFNDDTMTHTITLYLTDNITDYPITKITLPAGASWASDDQTGVNVGGAVTDGSKGDIAVSSGGDTWTINNGVVTLAKMADIATDRLIGRDTAGTGVPEAISVTGGIEFNGSGSIRVGAFSGEVGKTAGDSTLTITNGAVVTARLADGAVTPAKLSATAQALNFRNRLINGDFRVAQRGTSFTSTTVHKNDNDAYVLDRWYILSDGNDVIDVTQSTDVPTAPGALTSIALDVETTSKKFGIAQIIENRNCADMIGGTVSLSFKAKVSNATRLNNIKATVISWTGTTADSVNSTFITTWNAAGVTPTFDTTNLTTHSITSFTPTLSWATYKIENISLSSSAKNVIVFIWCDAVPSTPGDFLYITDVQLEVGATATAYERLPYDVQLAQCQRYFLSVGGRSGFGGTGGERFFGGWLARANPSVASYTAICYLSVPVVMRVPPVNTQFVKGGTWRAYALGNGLGYDINNTNLTLPVSGETTITLTAVVEAGGQADPPGGSVWFLFPTTADAYLGFGGMEL